MIVLNLSCEHDHRFEGWFGSADDFDAQSKRGDVACPVCGSVGISRQLSAPYVNTRSDTRSDATRPVAVANSARMLRQKFIEFVLQNTDDVGTKFPEEARRIHYAEAPERAIRGSASKKDIDELQKEGIDVLAVPGVPTPPDSVH
jgi:hypothetical protein